MSNSKNNSSSIRRKLALVIGNQSYVKKPLRHSENDADDLHDVLTKIDFKVDRELNCKYDKMKDAIKTFSEKITTNDLVLFYFAGHGFQYERQNYLMPLDAIQDSDEIIVDKSKLIQVDDIFKKLSAQTAYVTIFLLDCCRENLADYKIINLQDVETSDTSTKKTKKCTITGSRGLFKIRAAGGSIIQFACAPGELTADGYDQGRNGLYTKYLLQHIAQPKTEINLIFRRITRDIYKESKANQKPYTSSDIVTDEPIYLSAGDSEDATPSEAIRRKYQQYYVECFINTCQKFPIEECYINLSITRTEEQDKNERSLHSANSDDVFIYIYEEIYRNSTAIDIKDIFDKCKDQRKQVLITGRAGIGKSIFCRYAAYQWAEGQLWPHYELVVLIKLNSLTHLKYSLVDLMEKQYFPCENLSDSYKQYFTSLCGEGKVLWLLDGYDELPLNILHQPDSVLNTIYQTQHHILTSRPYAISLSYKTQVEIIGFTDANIAMYLNQSFEQPNENESESQNLLTYLKLNTKIWGIAHIPLHLELICCLWRDNKISMVEDALETQSLEVTMLYDKMVQWLCQQYLTEQKHTTVCNLTRTSFREKCKKELEFFENVAFHAMKDFSAIIDPKVFDEVEKTIGWFISDYPQLFNIGILKSFNDKRIGSHVDVKKPHYFVHLSFQEFFAASYIVTGLRSGRPENSINFIKANKYDQRFRLLLSFVSGLLTIYNEEQPIQYFWDAILNEPLDLVGLRHFDLIISCLEETRGSPSIHRRKEMIDYIVMWIKIGVDMKENKILDYIKQALQRSYILANEISIQKTLIQLMQREVPKTKILTLQLISKMPFSNFPEKLVDLMIRDLNNENYHLTDAIKRALSEILEHMPHDVVLQRLLHVFIIQENTKLTERVYQILYRIGNRSTIDATIQVLLLATKQESINLRQTACKLLGHFDAKTATEDVIKGLLTALTDVEPPVREVACKVLARFDKQEPTEEVVKGLLTALTDIEPSVREAACKVLAQLGEKAATEDVIQGLLTTLRDVETSVKKGACYALASFGEKAATKDVISGLLTTLRDVEPWVRAKACETIARFGEKAATKEVIEGLSTALRDQNYAVREDVCKALGSLGEKAATKEVIKGLLTALSDVESSVKVSACNALIRFGEKAATEEVIKAVSTALRDKNYDVREVVCKVLETFGEKAVTKGVIKGVLSALNDQNCGVKKSACKVLAQFGEQVATEEVIEGLSTALRDQNYAVREDVCKALGSLGEKAATKEVIKGLLTALSDVESSVKVSALYHKEAVEPYVVPFGSDHPGHVFRNTVDTAITRAVRYSTTLSQFEEEIRQMKLMFLYNGYSPRHIHRRLTTLFSKYLSKYFILPMFNNPDDFDYLRHQLLTVSTDKIYNRATKSSTTDQTSDKNMQNQLVQPTDNNEITKRKNLIIHKRHEQRLTQNQHHIHELWMRTFHGTDVTNTALIVGTCLNRNLKQELMVKMIKYVPNARSDKQGKTQPETGKQTHNSQTQLNSH
ncbi:unnamed protein product [Rotaria socialis]|uniref:NACHT domain-containing protein n=3 Tax=Rotaria socialis TaxID=392032 RepID=A0A818GX71_9BILA|nr:unnamed protein product [Rotaria socialis]